MFQTLTEKLLEGLRGLSGKGRMTEELLDEVCRQLRTTLLEADVNVKVVKDFVQAVRNRCATEQVQRSLTPEQHFIRIVYHELTRLMGGKETPLELKAKPPVVVLMVGLQGSGKTTTTVKLAKWIRERLNKRLLVASVDIHRPAAIEQLEFQLKAQGLDVFSSPVTTSASDRAILAKEEAIRQNAEVLLVDTAGRLHVDAGMMDELQEVSGALEPTETLLVVDGMAGQDAVHVAERFHERFPLTGIVLTKLDGDARGGAALSLRAVTGLPIKFIGTGEKAGDLEVFHPDRIASRILDMGDLLSLAEKAQQTVDRDTAIALTKKAKKKDFTLSDFYLHLQQVKKMGSFENLLKFLPGMGGLAKQLERMPPPETELKKIEAIILSMTREERDNHDLLDASRRRRIAKGSGTKVEDVNRLVKQFLEARKMMTRLMKSPMAKRRPVW
jgi:signal recognition particle subunit SRP54